LFKAILQGLVKAVIQLFTKSGFNLLIAFNPTNGTNSLAG